MPKPSNEVHDSVVWPNANPDVREQMMEQFKADGRTDATFVIERNNRNGLFFSADAVESVFDAMVALVAANILGEYENTGRPPYKLSVEVKVTTES